MGRLEKIVVAAGALVLAASMGVRYFRQPNSRFTDEEREFFEQNHVPLGKAESYNERFKRTEHIAELVKADVPPDVADSYDKSFNGKTIAAFVKHKISPEVAKGYLALKFTRAENGEFGCSLVNDAEQLAENNILPDAVLEYGERFSVREILELATPRSLASKNSFAEYNFSEHPSISAKVANAYHKNFKVYEIIMLQKEGIGPAEANEYAEAYAKFDASDIRKLHLSKVPAKGAGKFAGLFEERLNHWDIVDQVRTLFDNNVSFEEAQKMFELNKRYGVNISADDIVYFKKSNIPFEEVEKEAKRYMFDKVFER